MAWHGMYGFGGQRLARRGLRDWLGTMVHYAMWAGVIGGGMQEIRLFDIMVSEGENHDFASVALHWECGRAPGLGSRTGLNYRRG